ncbi:hypothetical protein GGS23DRAFT_598686 [Durotheca rogersii]|uniref:uncharacterized protein n=1 Tax=Durotheca rogersii TaxID=419775 RepID=UPI00221EEA57|nr:uncharacterized protein GGS23DRAFT_598686 [Durotheca rogersii]KAI5861158.1 hypothetical protein GGS23DRAFT_598686 [Durotheca rogersii]
MYVLYIGLLFWHSNDTRDSWAYLYATLSTWLATCVSCLFYKWQTFGIFRDWFQGFPSRLRALPAGITKMAILASPDFQRMPGRTAGWDSLTCSLPENHPFTISMSDHDVDVPASQTLVAGGNGVSACLPWMQHAARRIEAGPVTTSIVDFYVTHSSGSSAAESTDSEKSSGDRVPKADRATLVQPW